MLQYLFNNESLEKSFIEKLILEYNNDKMKLKSRNLIIFYDFLKKSTINEFNNQRFSLILCINIFKANFALYEFKESLKSAFNIINNNKTQIIENDIFNNFLPVFKLYLEKEINNSVILFNKKDNFLISLIGEDDSKFEIKISNNNNINNLIIQKDELNNEDTILIDRFYENPYKHKHIKENIFF